MTALGKGAGRPLRVLGQLLGGWVAMRVILLLVPTIWSVIASDNREHHINGRPSREMVRSRAAMAPSQPKPTAAIRQVVKIAIIARGRPGATPGGELGSSPISQSDRPWNSSLASPLGFARSHDNDGAVDRLTRVVKEGQQRETGLVVGGGLPIAPPGVKPRRWTGTAWILWRPDARSSLVQAPLLGGSQAGGRIDYRLLSGPAGQLGLYGRVGRAFTGPSSEEAALGVFFRPARLPISLLTERRQRLGAGGRSGFAVIAAGGIGPREVAPKVEAEGYAQAGVVGLPGLDGFADGKASIGYRLLRRGEQGGLTFGVSLSGGMQTGVNRLDIGPEVRLRLPLGATGMRLSVEWRERIAGEARPASGPAVTLVTDF